MRLHLVLILTSCLFSFTSNAQEFSLGYLGNNLWNPGINLSINKTIKENNHTIDLGIFRDPGSHTAAFAVYGLQKNKAKWSFAAYPIGIYRSFLPKTYEVTPNGSISEPSNLAGNFYFSPAIAVKRRHFKVLYSKIQFLVLIPYNTFVMPVLNIGVGYRINQKRKEKPSTQL